MASPSTPQTSQNSQSPPSPKVLTPEVLGNEIVTLYVGPKRKQFTVHKKLLCDRCEFFSKAFRGNFPEAEKGEMYLPEDHPERVACLIDYLYRGALPETKEQDRSWNLVHLYFLAEKLCMTVLMDKCCDAMRLYNKTHIRRPGAHQVRLVYSETCAGSKLRKYCAGVLSCATLRWSSEEQKEKMEKYVALQDECPDFFLDVFRWQAEHGKSISEAICKEGKNELALVELFGPCEFHSHGDNEECYLKGDN